MQPFESISAVAAAENERLSSAESASANTTFNHLNLTKTTLQTYSTPSRHFKLFETELYQPYYRSPLFTLQQTYVRNVGNMRQNSSTMTQSSSMTSRFIARQVTQVSPGLTRP